MIGRLALGVAGPILAKAQPHTVFVSYDHERDRHYRYMLDAWGENGGFEFTYHRRSPSKRIKSDSDASVKRVLTRQMKSAQILLVLVGEGTKDSDWVRWEIRRATSPDVNLRVSAVKLGNFRSPSELRGIGTSWATRFARDPIIAALQKARPARRSG